MSGPAGSGLIPTDLCGSGVRTVKIQAKADVMPSEHTMWAFIDPPDPEHVLMITIDYSMAHTIQSA